MRNIDEEFEKYDKKVREEEKRYANSETKWKDYNFPHIYLSDKDIKEFNNKCVELGIDLKVVPIDEYMNLNKPEKKEDNNDEEKMDDKMEKIDKAMEYLSKNFLPDKKKKLNLIKDNSYIINEVNDYIGKKQRRIADNHSEEENNNNSNSLSKEDEKDEDDEIEKRGRKIKNKRKNKGNVNQLPQKCDDYFRRIKNTRKIEINDEKRKNPLIKKILEKSQYLTQEDLKLLAKLKHIPVIDDTILCEFDLNKKHVNFLDSFLVDIKFNSEILKLNNGSNENIQKTKKRLERERQLQIDYLENKKRKEQKKNQDLISSQKTAESSRLKVIQDESSDSNSFSDEESL